jgi:hypothetical protein
LELLALDRGFLETTTFCCDVGKEIDRVTNGNDAPLRDEFDDETEFDENEKDDESDENEDVGVTGM